MARPRKPESEKLQPVMTSVTPSMLARLERIARARDIKVAALVRELLERRIAVTLPSDGGAFR